MHELPSNYNPNLPEHMAVLANGKLRDVQCAGKTVRDVVNDTGLFYGGCSHCAGEFVYMFRTDSWVTEKEFEALLHDNAGEIGKVSRSL